MSQKEPQELRELQIKVEQLEKELSALQASDDVFLANWQNSLDANPSRELATKALAKLCQRCGYEQAALYSYNTETDYFNSEFLYPTTKSKNFTALGYSTIDFPVATEMQLAGQTILLSTAHPASGLPDNEITFLQAGAFNSLISTPVIESGALSAHLCCGTSNPDYKWSKQEALLVKFFAILLTRTLERVESASFEYRSAEILQLVNEVSNTGYWVWERNLGIVEAIAPNSTNKASNFPSIDELAQSLHPDDQKSFIQRFEACRDNGDSFTANYRAPNKKGSFSWYRSHIKAVAFFNDKKARRIVYACTDITELAEQQRKTEEAVIKAQNADMAKSDFLARMSHEIRTPLNSILGFSELMQTDKNTPASQKEILDIINRSGEYLLSLINDTLEMSKIEAGHIKLNPILFDVKALLKTTEEMLHERCQDKQLQLSLEWSKDFPQYLYADEGKLKQILINLLGNSIKFTEHGSIALSASCKVLEADQLQLIIEVQDSGVGISNEEIDKVFGSFEQTDSGVKSGQGTGLGLTISREYARLMDGDITFTSQLNQGTTFRVEAICKPGHPNNIDEALFIPSPTVNTTKSSPSNYRILIVDDKENNRRLLNRILTPIGFNLKEATDGAQAIELFNSWQPHLILMDDRMPVMSGSEATQQIKACNTGKNIPIIAISASAFEEDRQRLLSQGANEFIRKPFKNTEVLAKIDALLNQVHI